MASQTSSTVNETRETEKTVRFHDDLRAGDFTYVKDSDGICKNRGPIERRH